MIDCGSHDQNGDTIQGYSWRSRSMNRCAYQPVLPKNCWRFTVYARWMYSTSRPVVRRMKPSVVGSMAGNQNPTHFCHGLRATGSGAVSGVIPDDIVLLSEL